MTRENRWRLVFVSAAIAFPFALALAYLVSNPLVKRVARRAHVPPALPVGRLGLAARPSRVAWRRRSAPASPRRRARPAPRTAGVR